MTVAEGLGKCEGEFFCFHKKERNHLCVLVMVFFLLLKKILMSKFFLFFKNAEIKNF